MKILISILSIITFILFVLSTVIHTIFGFFDIDKGIVEKANNYAKILTNTGIITTFLAVILVIIYSLIT